MPSPRSVPQAHPDPAEGEPQGILLPIPDPAESARLLAAMPGAAARAAAAGVAGPAAEVRAGAAGAAGPLGVPAGFRSGFVALIGRPNVGKSTLLNQLVGQKVAITSPVAQTTRNRLRAILTTPSAQLVLLDTPGIHKPHHLLGQRLVQSARGAIGEVDLVLLLVDASQPAGRGDAYIVELLRHSRIPVMVCLNKCDQIAATQAEALIASYRELIAGADGSADPGCAPSPAQTPGADSAGSPAAAPQGSSPSSSPPAYPPASSAERSSHATPSAPSGPQEPAAAGADPVAAEGSVWAAAGVARGSRQPWPLHRVSALTGEGCQDLVQALSEALPPGPYLYPADAVSDQPEQLLLAELIREQVLQHTREEVPHSVAVMIDRIVEDGPRTAVLATVLVERSSQKGILIGKGGSMLRTIGRGARLQMQKLIDGPVYLELFVKVVPGWRSHPGRLAELGYRGD